MEAYENRSPMRLWLEGLTGEAVSFTRLHLPRTRTRFCIFGQGRTGSTLLTTLLDSHPDIRCEDELLRRPRLKPLLYLDRVSRGTEAAFGFHLKPYHLTRFQRVTDLGGFLRRLTEADWTLVHLTRRDVIAHAFSSFHARKHGWHHRTSDARETTLIEIDPERFVQKVKKRLAWREREAAALEGLEVFPFCYENHLLDPAVRGPALAALVRHLGLREVPLSTPLRKSVRGSPWDVVANPDAVREALLRAGVPPE